ncbi:MAG: phosphoribosylformylglycinamidine cyclo-ligase [Christensenellaceae bacterium]
MAISYKDSGVDVTRGYKAVDLMKKYVKTTYNDNVLGDIGSFGGFYSISGEKMEEPVLVAGTDGVGTKLKYAFLLEKHDTIGIDAVAMCVNDIVCQGAKPLFFLDYYACGRLYPEAEAQVVKGIAEGCRQAGCALIGGETAEMPGFYPDGEYDLAGFAVGIVDKKKVINGKNIQAGDVLLGIKSSGVHSNGYSLVRKLFGDSDRAELEKYDERLGASPPKCCYPDENLCQEHFDAGRKGTRKGNRTHHGRRIYRKYSAYFPRGIGCEIDKNSYEVPAVFRVMQERAGISDEQIYNTFNMGIGMVVASPENAAAAAASLKESGEEVVVLGRTTEGKGVTLK